MNLQILYIIATALFVVHCTVDAIEFFTTTLTVGFVSSLYVAWKIGYCKIYECCDNDWIKNDFKGLQYDFQSKVHGQHVATEIVLNLLEDHLKNPSPVAALVLSFNGRTGSGKNHVTNLALRRIFKRGVKSKAVHYWHSRLHFAHPSQVREYQVHVESIVMKKLRFCPRAIFIFDEADQIPKEVTDILTEFLGYQKPRNGIEFMKATYIFLSNTGGNEVAKIAETYFEQLKDRESFTRAEVFPLVSKGVFKDKSGVENLAGLTYVPFLPLEKKHVKLCIEDELMRRGCLVKDKFVHAIGQSMEYDSADLHSLTGCKTVEVKINIMLDYDCHR